MKLQAISHQYKLSSFLGEAQINKKRDAVEKIFDTLKNSVGDGRLHGYSDENISGRLFLAFTTAILHALLENRLRNNELLTKYTAVRGKISR